MKYNLSVLLSVQPRWVDKICTIIGERNGQLVYEKEDEVRKSRPNLSVPFKVYIYESRRRKVYFWHISALKIYDKPRELSEFKRPCPVGDCQECKFALWQTNTFISESKIVGCTQKIKAPQSWCYVMEEQNWRER